MPHALAATYTYSNVTGNFSTGFSPALPLGGTTYSDTLSFAGASYSASDDAAAPLLLNSLLVANTGAVQLLPGSAASLLSFGGVAPSLTFNNTGTINLHPNVTLAVATTITGTGSATLSGVISGSGSMTKAGNGTVTFGGVNSYTGATTMSAGILDLSTGSDILTTKTILNGGILIADSINDFGTGRIDFNGGTLKYTSGSSFDISSRAVTFASGGASIDTNSSNVSYRSAIGGTGAAGSLTKLGSGILTLAGTETYSGGTTISGGVLSGSTSSLQGNIVDGASLDFTQSVTGSYSGVISGSGNVTIGVLATPGGNAGSISWTGANTYTGATVISGAAGTLSTLNANNTLATSNITVNANGIINISPGAAAFFTNSSGAPSLTLGSGTFNLNGSLSRPIVISVNNVLLTSGSTSFVTVKAAASQNTTLNLSTITSQSGSSSIDFNTVNASGGTAAVTATNANIAGTGILGGYATYGNYTTWATNSGTGNVIAGLSSYTGFTAAGTGGNVDCSGSVTLPASTNKTVGTLRFNTPATTSLDLNGNILTLSSGGVLCTSAVGTNFNSISNGTLTSTYADNPGNIKSGDLYIDVASSVSTLTVGSGAVITDANAGLFHVNLVKGGAGILDLSSTANTYGGGGAGTYLNGGYVQTNSIANFGASSFIAFNGGGVLFGSSSYDLSVKTLIFGPGGAVFDTNANNPTFSSTIGGGGTGGLFKQGVGTLTIKGAGNYTGGAYIAAGAVSGATTAYGSGTVSVAPGATADYTQNGATTYAASITGSGNVTIGGNPGGGLIGGGTITYTGVDNANSTTVSNGTLVLNRSGGGAITGPVAIAVGGTVGLGADNQLAPTSTVTMMGGTLAANGHSEGTTTAAGVGSLLLANSIGNVASDIDFGDISGIAAGNTLAFADSSTQSWSGMLNLTNYTDGADMLYIGTSADLTPAQLNRIKFSGLTASQSSTGLIGFHATPEPSGSVSMLFGFYVLGSALYRGSRPLAAKRLSQ